MSPEQEKHYETKIT